MPNSSKLLPNNLALDEFFVYKMCTGIRPGEHLA